VADIKTTDDDAAARKAPAVASSGGWWLQRVVLSFVHFIREIVAELRKVIWPSRQELITYTTVVVVFVIIMISIVAGLDYGFARLTLWLFG
jgi:preprotein translocase SecE subunit